MSPEPSTLVVELENNENGFYFKQILSKFEKNDIKFVVFTTPLHHFYLNSLSNSTKINFEILLDNFSQEYNFSKYDFTDKYSTMPIWNNPDHIAFNENAHQYSDDIGTMIVRELDE